MPDINEGLEVGGERVVQYEPGDVNTQGGFEQALAKAAGIAETPDEGTAGGETPPEGEPATAQTPPAEGTEEEPVTEAPNEWQIRYEEANKVIGRQGQELGELRRAIEEIRSERESGYEAPVAPALSMAPGEIEQLIADRGGDAVMQWAIAAETTTPGTIDAVRRAWLATGEPDALEFNVEYLAEQRVAEAMRGLQPRETPAPQIDPTLNDIALERKLTTVWSELRTSDPEFESYKDGIRPALESEGTPDEIKMMLMSGNLEHMRAATQFLRPYAQVQALRAGVATPAATAAASAAAAQREQATQETKRATAIVSGSQRLSPPAGEQSSDELTREQRIARFKDSLVSEETTDIASGLTVGGKPVQERPAFSAR